MLSLFIVAGCGGGGGGGGTGVSDAPSIFDLIVTALDPERANRTVRYLLGVNYVDAQGDVFNGTCEVETSIGNVSIPINQLAPGVDPDATQGSVICGIQVRVPAPTQVSGTVTIVDRAGHRSNALAFVLGLRLQSEGAPGDGAGAAEIRGEAGSLGRSR